MSVATPRWGKYTELRPDALAAIRAAVPVAYLPWGALEWHGPHLPLGLDGMIAEDVAERIVQCTGGVLLPTTWWPITAMPHAASLAIDSETVRHLWADIFAQLAGADWRVIVVISGHYAPAHELVLMESAMQAMQQHAGLLVLALPPLALVDEEMLDHGALWETSVLLALRANLVDLDALGTGALSPADSGVLGRDPRGLASASLGNTTLDLAVKRMAGAVEQLLHEGSVASLKVLYERRRVRYQTYIDHCKHASPEEAAQIWWESMTASVGDQPPTSDEPAPDDPITRGPAADGAARNERQDQDPGKVNGRLKAKEWGSDNSTGNR
ncbi:MAG: creatininase family protein [Chloroflexaceae bacterium]